MKNSKSLFVLCALYSFYFGAAYAVRLHKIFSYIEGIASDYDLRGFLHIGNEYAVFLRAPKSHDKVLTYELYEARNVENIKDYRPKLLAVSHIPVQYIKDQLRTFKNELFQAKYMDKNTVPGSRVQSVREWQLDRALHTASKGGLSLFGNQEILRSFAI